MRPCFPDVLFLLALAVVLGCCHHAVRADRPLFTAPRNPGYATLVSLDIGQVQAELRQGGALLVDARPQEAFLKATIPDSLSLPLHSNLDIEILAKLRQARTVIVFCSDPRCQASKQLAVQLRSQGVLALRVFPGGVAEWRRAQRPLLPGRL